MTPFSSILVDLETVVTIYLSHALGLECIMISSLITLNSPNTSFQLIELVGSVQHCQREERTARTVSHDYAVISYVLWLRTFLLVFLC